MSDLEAAREQVRKEFPACGRSVSREKACEQVERFLDGFEQLLKIADQAIERSRLPLSAEAIKAAHGFAKKIKLDRFPGKLSRAHDALQALCDGIEVVQAKGQLGIYLSTTRGRWDLAAEFLAEVPSEEFSSLVKRDQAAPTEAQAMLSLADGWWDAQHGLEPVELRAVCRDRAEHWYVEALPSLQGLGKLRAKRRLALIKPSAARSENRPRPNSVRVPIGKQQLVNAGCESLIGSQDGGWVTGEGSWTRRVGGEGRKNPPAKGGRFIFAPAGAMNTATLYQDVDLSKYAAAVDGGKIEALLKGFVACFRQSPGDQGRIGFEFYDANMEVVGPGYTSDLVYSPTWKGAFRSAAASQGHAYPSRLFACQSPRRTPRPEGQQRVLRRLVSEASASTIGFRLLCSLRLLLLWLLLSTGSGR